MLAQVESQLGGFGGDVAGALAYSIIGIALMVLGFFIVDWLTPGKLGELIWTHRNRNASLLLSSNLVGVGLIVVGAIWASEGDLVQGVISTFVFGVIGLGAMAVAFLILDLITPGKLGALVVDEEPHPAVWVSSAMHLALGGVIAMALS
ncbi:DUF350 domain-containing protein [Glycomyces sp. NPDC021274]|uniref:DUF350 domain-containing protein n=1 Tax=Glycomyces sp. NPDC021274 TaxID=3155120 RepID=UPI0033DBD082